MKRLVDVVRNSILVADPYLISKLPAIQEQVRVTFADEPLFPEGVLQHRTIITLQEESETPHLTIANLFEATLFIDFYSDISFEAVEDLYHNQATGVITAYGYPQGVRDLLTNRVYNFSDLHILKAMNLGKRRVTRQDETKQYLLSTYWRVSAIITPVLLAKP